MHHCKYNYIMLNNSLDRIRSPCDPGLDKWKEVDGCMDGWMLNNTKNVPSKHLCLQLLSNTFTLKRWTYGRGGVRQHSSLLPHAHTHISAPLTCAPHLRILETPLLKGAFNLKTICIGTQFRSIRSRKNVLSLN